jgi:hypothetical protein
MAPALPFNFASAWADRGETNMAKIISFDSNDSKKAGGVLQAMRRLWAISIPATAAISATLAIGFAIAMDGCSSGSKKTNVSSSTDTGSLSKSLPTPTPSLTSTADKGKVATKKKSPVQHSTSSYVDSGSGVSFRYPREYTLTTPEKAKLNSELLERVPMNFVQPGGEKVATVALPGKLVTPLLGVNVHKGLTEGQCEQFADPDAADVAANSKADPDDESIPVKVSMRGRGFTRVENGTEQTDTRYYHHFENGACYEFVLAVAESPDNKIAVDHFELFDNLERIMASVEIKSGAPASVTASVPATPANVSKPQ